MSEENDVIIIPEFIKRFSNLEYAYTCPFILKTGMKIICTHPLAPLENVQEEWLQQQIDLAYTNPNAKRYMIKPCKITDALNCPFLKVMPLIDFNQLNLEEVP